jgi:Glycosyl hydrolase family 59/Domain of Unknown Function (DUF1080)
MKLCSCVAFLTLLCSVPLSAQTIRLDASSPGRTFDGLGALSAGASSRLLVDYPEPQRSQILDYLFKPNYGAGLQHLKVEIGADVNSTDGSEPSHMRSATDHDYTRGYEWWLMHEARKRNPDIILDTLAWGAPGWIGNGKYYSHDMAEYVADFLEGAKKQGLNVQYTGVWNERKPDFEWVKDLRAVLDEHHLQTKIVCCDMYPSTADPYEVAYAMGKDPQLSKAVDVIGVHYPHSIKTGLTPNSVIQSGRTIWSSEDQPNPGGGPFVAREWNFGGRIMARRYNENYIKGRMTKTEIWSPITSYYDNLAAPNSGLMYANTPWSGHYDVQSTIWVTAHTTQFAQPGWKYMDDACGFLPNDGGSYVSLQAPSSNGHAEWSVVLETINSKAPQHLTLRVGQGLATTRVHIWETNSIKTFEKVADLPLKNGSLEYAFEPDAIYSITTTTGQAKGTALPPPPAPFPFPYRDDFEKTPHAGAAKYLADQDGAFEAQPCVERGGQCLTQVITRKPIPWRPIPYPFTLAGDSDWKDYRVGVDMLLPEAGNVMLMGRIDSADIFLDKESSYASGYIFELSSDGNWRLLSTRFKMPSKVLATGTYSSVGKWHHGELKFQGSQITMLLDGKQIGTVDNTDHTHGMIAIGSDWKRAQFDNLSIEK